MIIDNGAFNDYNFYRNGIVFVNMIETYIPPKVAQKNIQILCKLFPNIQFFISTRSLDILRKANKFKIYDVDCKKEIMNINEYLTNIINS